MTSKALCDKHFKDTVELGKDFPFTMNNIIEQDLDDFLKEKDKSPEEIDAIKNFPRNMGSGGMEIFARCLKRCLPSDSDSICRHKKRFYFGLGALSDRLIGEVEGSPSPIVPDETKHHIIYNDSKDSNVSLRHSLLTFEEGIEKNEEKFYDHLTKLDNLYEDDKNIKGNIKQINDLEKFVIDNYVYFYLKNQTDKSIKNIFKFEDVTFIDEYDIIHGDDSEKLGHINQDTLSNFQIMFNTTIPPNFVSKSKSIVYFPKTDDLKLDYENDSEWYKSRNEDALPLSKYYEDGLEETAKEESRRVLEWYDKFLTEPRSQKTKITMKNRLGSVLSFFPRRRSASVTLGRGKKKKQKNTSRKSKKKKKKTLIKSVRRKK